MSKADKIKEQIGWLKVAFGILVAVDISLIGWLAGNYETAPGFHSIAALVLVTVISLGIVEVNRIAFRKMDELEEL